MHRTIAIALGLASILTSTQLQGQNFPTAEQVAAEAMARAQAEKARNDEIVRQQRQNERVRREQEQRLRDFERAERRGRTG